MRTEIKVAIVVGLLVIVGAIIWTVSDASREKQISELPASLVSSGGKAAEPARTGGAAARPDPFARPAPASDAGRPTAGATPPDARAAQAPRTESGSRPVTVHPPPPREPVSAAPSTLPPATAADAKNGTPPSGGPLPPLAPPIAAEREASRPGELPRPPSADAKPAGAVEPPVVTPPTLEKPASGKEPGESRGSAAPPAGPGARPVPAQSDTAARPAQAQPAAGATGETIYTVQEADTLSAIAREVYGDDRLWTRIRDANPGIDPDRLLVGQKLRIPSKEAVRAGKPAAPAADASKAGNGAKPPEAGKPAEGKPPREAPGAATKSAAQDAGTYVVESGDTLIRIARKLFNDPNRWREIYDLNRDKLRSPDEVPVGVTLKVPPARKERGRERG